MRAWPLLVILLLPGCVSELLGPPDVTTRTVACAVLAPDVRVHVVQHPVSEAVPEAVRDHALSAWMRDVAAITGKTDEQFSTETVTQVIHDGPWDRESLRPWIDSQRVLGDTVNLRVLWVPSLPEPRAVEPLAPGFLLINASSWNLAVVSGHDGQEVAQALLYHGLGHLMGVVNMGVPLHEPEVASREEPQHHEPDGVMSVDWHHWQAFPRNVTLEYSDGLVGDWRHAQTSPAVCA